MRLTPDYTITATDAELLNLGLSPSTVNQLTVEPERGRSGGTSNTVEYDPLPITPWEELFAGVTVTDAIVEGLILPGRWVSIVAAAKTGKSSLLLHIATALTRGRDPFTAAPRPPLRVLYLDLEMGRLDVVERLTELGLGPADLAWLDYLDIVPKCDQLQGATAVVSKVNAVGHQLVIVDGMNGLIDGAEKDDVPWRRVFDYLIAPLKRAGVAVLTADNTGKDKTLGARGSSVKADKPDGVLDLTRTDNGVRLKATHRRTAAIAAELTLIVKGGDGDQALDFHITTTDWPAGTADAARTLDKLGVPLDHGRNKARVILKMNGVGMRDSVLAAALKYRQIDAKNGGNRCGNRSREQVPA
jgi:KaiC/GvpD/RAD55 family RecA-like ATPase